jgi:serine/threonine protein kinase
MHEQGYAHRDLKPENILWFKNKRGGSMGGGSMCGGSMGGSSVGGGSEQQEEGVQGSNRGGEQREQQVSTQDSWTFKICDLGLSREWLAASQRR